jgi:GH24 family phage-related lysozyme (muramidase)
MTHVRTLIVISAISLRQLSMGSRFRGVVAAAAFLLVGVHPLSAQCENEGGFQRLKCEAQTRLLLGPIVDELTKRQAITSSFADRRPSATLPETFTPASFSPLGALDRTPDGAFILHPGAYEATVPSFCLHAGTHGPSKGDGYWPVPLAGPKSNMVRTILHQFVNHSEVSQVDVQLLLWGILAHDDYQHMPASVQRAAYLLLTPQLLAELRGGPLAKLPDQLRQPLEAKVQEKIARLEGPLRNTLQAESQIREQMTASASYQTIEQIAILPGESGTSGAVPRGLWVQDVRGYYVRYLPEGYQRTKIQVFVPDRADPPAVTAAALSFASTSSSQYPADLLFDPADAVAAPANAGNQRLGITGPPGCSPGCDTSGKMLPYLRSCEGTAPGGGYGAYNDSLGNCTTGYGHLVAPRPCTSQEMAQYRGETQAQAETQLKMDYETARQWVCSNASGLNCNQQDALVDLVFNMGSDRLQTHDVWTDVTGGNLDKVPADIMTLTAGGAGITQRRRNEVNIWTNGVYPTKCY